MGDCLSIPTWFQVVQPTLLFPPSKFEVDCCAGLPYQWHFATSGWL
jgi:hypothetical protein